MSDSDGYGGSNSSSQQGDDAFSSGIIVGELGI